MGYDAELLAATGVGGIGPLYPNAGKVAEFLLHGDFNDPIVPVTGTNNGATSTVDRFGIADRAFTFDGAAYGEVSGLLVPLALSTEGAVLVWEKNNATEAEKILFSCSNNASSTITELVMEIDYRVGSKLYVCFLIVDGVTQWSLRTVINSAIPDVGIPAFLHLDHQGTQPQLFRKGVDTNATFTISTDKTKWFKSVITDATTKADTASIGTLRRNGSLVVPFQGDEDDVVFYDESQAANALSIYNRSKP